LFLERLSSRGDHNPLARQNRGQRRTARIGWSEPDDPFTGYHQTGFDNEWDVVQNDADSIFALVRRDPGAPSILLFGDLFMTGNGRSIDRIIEQTPNDARYFAGFVGWMPDELASELERGFWYVTEPDAALVFQKDPGSMWSDLMRRLGKEPHPPGKGEIDTKLDAGQAG